MDTVGPRQERTLEQVNNGPFSGRDPDPFRPCDHRSHRRCQQRRRQLPELVDRFSGRAALHHHDHRLRRHARGCDLLERHDGGGAKGYFPPAVLHHAGTHGGVSGGDADSLNNHFRTHKYFQQNEILNREVLPLRDLYKKKVREYFKKTD